MRRCFPLGFAGAGRECGGGSMKVFTPARQVRSGSLSGKLLLWQELKIIFFFPFPDFYSTNSTLTCNNLTVGSVSSSSQIHFLSLAFTGSNPSTGIAPTRGKWQRKKKVHVNERSTVNIESCPGIGIISASALSWMQRAHRIRDQSL